MTTGTVSTFTSMAMEHWLPYMSDITLQSQPLLKRIRSENLMKPTLLKVEDDKILIPAKLGYGMSARIVAESAYLPTSTVSTFGKMTAKVVTVKDRRIISWEAMRKISAGGDYVKGVDAARDVMENIFKSIGHRVETLLWGFPHDTINGVIGTITTGASSTDQTIKVNASSHNGKVGNRWCARGMPIVIASAVDFAGSSWSTTNDVRVISSVSTDGTTITLTASHSSTTGDYVVPGEYANSTRYSDYNCGFNGLYQHVNNNTGTYQGVTRSSYPEFMGNIVTTGTAGSNAAVTEAMVDEALDKASEITFAAEDAVPDLILCTPKMRRTLKALNDGVRKYDIGEQVLVGGEQRKLRILDTLKPVTSSYAHKGIIWFLRTDSFIFAHQTEGNNGESFIEFDKEGGILKRVGTAAETDGYETLARFSGNLICPEPNKNTGLRDITET